MSYAQWINRLKSKKKASTVKKSLSRKFNRLPNKTPRINGAQFAWNLDGTLIIEHDNEPPNAKEFYHVYDMSLKTPKRHEFTFNATDICAYHAYSVYSPEIDSLENRIQQYQV